MITFIPTHNLPIRSELQGSTIGFSDLNDMMSFINSDRDLQLWYIQTYAQLEQLSNTIFVKSAHVTFEVTNKHGMTGIISFQINH